MRRINPKLLGWVAFVLAWVLIAVVFTQCSRGSKDKPTPSQPSSSAASVAPTSSAAPSSGTSAQANDKQLETLVEFAKNRNIPLSQFTAGLAALSEKHPEAMEFVYQYPTKKNYAPEFDLSGVENSEKMPLFIQWDERWGYTEYAGNLMGLSGCGPTCLSMVCVYLLKDSKYDPKYVAQFSEANKYCTKGNGSNWTLISRGGVQLGLNVQELPLSANLIKRNLEAGNPVICVVGPGDFTSTGHYIVLTEYIDGKVRVNDPNSRVRSAKLWELDPILPQIRNLWACSV